MDQFRKPYQSEDKKIPDKDDEEPPSVENAITRLCKKVLARLEPQS